MNTEHRDVRLTAFALNDPSVTEAERIEFQKLMATNATVRRAVEETRQLKQILTAGLLAEEEALPAGKAVTIPAGRAAKPSPAWKRYPAVAASVALLFCGVVFATGAAIWANIIDESGKRDRAAELAFQEAVNGLKARGPQTVAEPEVQFSRDGRPTGEMIQMMSKFGSHRSPGSAQMMPAQPQGGIGSNLQGRSFGGNVAGLDSAPGGVPTEMRPGAHGSNGAYSVGDPAELPPGAIGNDRFPPLQENPFIKVEGENAISTFGVDVDTASYSIVRRFLTQNQMPPPNAVRLEEMINYFPYADKAPDGNDPYAVTVEMAECPWETKHRLVRLGLKAKPIDNSKRPPSNLVFLIDVSGSMNTPDRLPLVKESLKLLTKQLGENDRVAMVVYAGNSGLVLDSTSASRKELIIEALDRLEAGGSTNGAGGIQQAYDVAIANYIKGGTNRVILCTDGDWNVGTTGTDDLVKLIENKRKSGVYLSVFGFGMGNLRDEMMVNLAGKGNGNYGYISDLKEANKALVEQISGTLVTVAKDVKIQIEFKAEAVKSYRLIGYEKRILATKDFNDDTKDAGEMGAGHVVTCLYELIPAEAKKDAKPKEAFVVKMRHKRPDADASTLRELKVSNDSKGYEMASEDFRFSAAVASFGMLLRGSPYKGNSTYASIIELAQAAKKHDPSGYRGEFVDLVRKAKDLAGK